MITIKLAYQYTVCVYEIYVYLPNHTVAFVSRGESLTGSTGAHARAA